MPRRHLLPHRRGVGTLRLRCQEFADSLPPRGIQSARLLDVARRLPPPQEDRAEDQKDPDHAPMTQTGLKPTGATESQAGRSARRAEPGQILATRPKYSSSSFFPPHPFPSTLWLSTNSMDRIHFTIL